MAKVPKAKNQHSACRTADTSTKEEQLETIGIKRQQAHRFEQLAKHPEAVEMAKASGGDRKSEKIKSNTTETFDYSKAEQLKNIGISKQKQKPLLFRQKNLQRLHTKTQ